MRGLFQKLSKLSWLFVSERKQIALMADTNIKFASPLRDKSLRNEDTMKKLLSPAALVIYAAAFTTFII